MIDGNLNITDTPECQSFLRNDEQRVAEKNLLLQRRARRILYDLLSTHRRDMTFLTIIQRKGNVPACRKARSPAICPVFLFLRSITTQSVRGEGLLSLTGTSWVDPESVLISTRI